MNNESLRKDDLQQITKKLFKEALFLCYKDGITSIAPLGFSGDTIILHGSKNLSTSRVSQVSIRNYSNDAELLITDAKGNFLFYGRFDINLGVEFVINQYWAIFNKVKDKIGIVLPDLSNFKNIKFHENCSHSIGFDMLKAYQYSMWY